MKSILNFLIMILKSLWKGVEKFTEWELRTINKIVKLPVKWYRVIIVIVIIVTIILLLLLDGPLCVPDKYC